MSPLALIVALLIAATPAPAELAPVEPVRVVFVASDEGGFSAEHQAAILARVERALAFWHERSPQPIATQVEPAGTLAAPADLTLWLADITPHSDYTVYVVYNEVSTRPLPGGRYGAASHAYRFALVTSAHPLDAEATLAHELGHLLYDLRHTCEGDGGSDIMCNEASAYPHRLGCGTLAQLGQPCMRLWFGMVRA